MNKNIAILTGGTSSERDVSLRSSQNMKNWVEISGYTATIFDFPKEVNDFLAQYGKYDLVIPVFHGTYGEDGQVTAFLKTLGCRYAYSDFETHTLCINKYTTNLLVQKMGVKIPRSLLIPHGYYIEHLIDPLVCYPIIMKPNTGGSSIATFKVESRKELVEKQKESGGHDILMQEYIEGREFTVGIYRDAHGFESLPVMEVKVLKQAFFDYEEKYESDGSNEVFLEGEEDIQKTLQTKSLRIAEFLGIRGVVRIDWRYDGKDFYFLEVNTIPGFTSASFIPKMWKKAGKTEKEFVDMMMV